MVFVILPDTSYNINILMKSKKEFDPIAWSEGNTQHTQETFGDNLTFVVNEKTEPTHSDADRLLELISQLVEERVCITDDYNDWLRVGLALANELGEAGRSAFHQLSQMSPKYDAAECDRKYDNILRTTNGSVTAGTLFHLAREAGVENSHTTKNVDRQIRKLEETTKNSEEQESLKSLKSLKSPIVPNNEKIVKNRENPIFCAYGTSETSETSETNSNDETMKNYYQDTTEHFEVRDTRLTFSDRLSLDDLPSILHPIFKSETDAVGRDKMLLGTLNVISGLLPDTLYSLYDGRRVHAPLYNIIYGRPATTKGDLEAVRHIADPIKLEMRHCYEAELANYETERALWDAKNKKDRGPQPVEPRPRNPFITANSSASAVYRSLDANGGWGMIFETEADTLTSMLSKSDYGDYSDLMRKAYHHETIAMNRVGDRINIEIDKPRLAIFLTCTGSQLPLLLPPGNVANGLASRFLFYALPDNKVEFRNVFERNNLLIDDVYRNIGQQVLALYHALQMRAGRPIQFLLGPELEEKFVSSFNALLNEQFSMQGDGIQAFIFRIAHACYRYAMILTVLRRISERYGTGQDTFDADEQALVCDERDYRTAMTIIDCLVSHTARVYAVIGDKDDDPFRAASANPCNSDIQRLYDALPADREFTTAEFAKIAETFGLSKSTYYRYLNKMANTYYMVKRMKHGVYVKQ